MYPSGELTQLAARKALLQARIAVRRWECASAAAELARPIAMIDRGIELWRRLEPLIKMLGIPTALLFARKFKRGAATSGSTRGGRIGTILRLLPLILRGLRTFRAFRATRSHRERESGMHPAGSRL